LTYKIIFIIIAKKYIFKNIFFIWRERLVSAFSMKKKIEFKKNKKFKKAGLGNPSTRSNKGKN
jgi:hypothetical protein